MPKQVASELLAAGFLQQFEDGGIHWNHVVPLCIQQTQLLELMPEGHQKRALEQKFGIAAGTPLMPPMHAPVAQTAPIKDGATAAANLELMAILRDLKALMASQASGAPRAELQALEIVDEFEKWVMPEDWTTKHRNNFPFMEAAVHDEEFEKFMEVRRLKPGSRKIYMKGLARFLMMVKPTDGSNLDRQNILINVFRSNLFQKLQELPILSADYSCTRATVDALGHFAVMTKLRLQGAGDSNGAQMVDQLITGHLSPWSKRCYAAHKESLAKKYEADAKLVEKYHKPDELKKVAYSKYLDLMTIHNAVCVEKTHQLTQPMLFKATSCVITGFYTNAPPGRSMELEALPRKTVDEFLDTEGTEHFPFSKYKTVTTYGTGGKWVNAANRQALVLYREIVDTAPELGAEKDPGNVYFFKNTTVHCCLNSVTLAEGLDPPLRVNLMRKVFAVWAKLNKTTEHKGETDENLFAKVARMDKHSPFTADAIYAVITPEEDARLAKHCFLRLMGKPIEFPSSSQWKKNGRALQDVMRKMTYRDDSADGEEAEADKDFDELVDHRDDGDDSGDDWGDVLEIEEDEDENDDLTESPEDGEQGDVDGLERKQMRSITFDRATGKFAKHDPNPNLISHPPPRAYTQLTMDQMHPHSGSASASGMEPPAANATAGESHVADEEPLPAPRQYPFGARTIGRQSIFSNEEKQWIYIQHQNEMGRDASSVAPNSILKVILDTGTKANKLPAEATVEKIREVLRHVFR